jgi:gamma-glutamylcysteine synthetase
LKSVALGLYEEVDKLSKKAPAELVTDLALQQINDVIRETKELIKEDAYVQRLNEFVAAGDNPELRDSLMVLRQLLQGLDRFQNQLAEDTKKAIAKRNEARFVALGLTLIEEGEDIDRQSLKTYEHGETIFDYWMTRDGRQFDVETVYGTDLTRHFG